VETEEAEMIKEEEVADAAETEIDLIKTVNKKRC
jgi:hypothetical protein